MQSDIDRVLIPHYRIAARVRELAGQIAAAHGPRLAESGELTIVPILTGAFIFCGDLIRQMPVLMRIGLLTVSSYPGQSLRTQGSKLLGERLGDVRGRHVLILDDILESGGTLNLVTTRLKELGAASVESCVLLRKERAEPREAEANYVGFDIPDEFVVGYGLDFNDYYRNLPDIVTLRKEAIERGGTP